MSKLTQVMNFLGRGFASLGEGMSRITLFPLPVEYGTNPHTDYMKHSQYIKPPTAEEAMRHDWQKVGHDMRRAATKVMGEHNKP